MSPKNLAILALVAALAIATALWLSSDTSDESADDGQSLVFPALSDALNDVTRIEVRPADGQPVTVSRHEDEWRVDEVGGYPADLSSVRAALLALADARILEAKTSQPERYPKLGVADPESEDADSLLVQVATPDKVRALIVGRYEGSLRPGTYVRRPGEAESYLVSGDLAFDREAVNWLQRDVLNVTAAEVESIRISRSEGDDIALSKGGEERTNFEVLDVPEGRELSSPAAGNPIAGALSSLRMDAVYPQDAVDLAALENRLTASFTLFDGRQYEITAGKREDEALIHIAGSFDRDRGEAFATAKHAAGELPAQQGLAETDAGDTEVPEVELPDFAEVEAQAKAVNERLSHWVFAIPGYKFDALNKTMDDLLKPLEESGSDDSE